MGTRVDYYVGRGPEMQWIGSYCWDGYPSELANKQMPGGPEIRCAQTEAEFRTAVDQIRARGPEDDFTLPDKGWPWPWGTSETTDYAYAFDGDRVYMSNFGSAWSEAAQLKKDEPAPKGAVFPVMRTDKARPAGSPGSGNMLIIGGPHG